MDVSSGPQPRFLQTRHANCYARQVCKPGWPKKGRHGAQPLLVGATNVGTWSCGSDVMPRNTRQERRHPRYDVTLVFFFLVCTQAENLTVGTKFLPSFFPALNE